MTMVLHETESYHTEQKSRFKYKHADTTTRDSWYIFQVCSNLVKISIFRKARGLQRSRAHAKCAGPRIMRGTTRTHAKCAGPRKVRGLRYECGDAKCADARKMRGPQFNCAGRTECAGRNCVESWVGRTAHAPPPHLPFNAHAMQLRFHSRGPWWAAIARHVKG